MKATQRAQPKLPTVTRDAKTVGSVKTKAGDELDKRYSIASNTNKKFGLITNVLAKNAKRVDKLEKDREKQSISNKQSVVQNTTLPAIASSFNIIISSLQRINGVLAKASGIRAVSADIPQPDSVERPSPSPNDLPPGGSVSPLMIIAGLGLTYFAMTDEQRASVRAFLTGIVTGFNQGLDENEKNGFGSFNTALKVAAGLIIANLSISVLGGAANAILGMIRSYRKFNFAMSYLGVKGNVASMATLAAGGAIGGYAAYKGMDSMVSGVRIDSMGNLSATGGEHTIGKSEAGNAKEAIDFFISKGWTKEQAIGIAANLQAESEFKTNATGDNGKAYGIAQWHPDRQERFKQLYGKDIRDAGFKEQLEFVNWELSNTEKHAGNKIRGATTAEEAAALVDQFYERSSGAHRQKRMDIASAYAKGIVPAASAPMTATAPPTSNPPQVAAAATSPTTSSAQPSPAMAKNIKEKSESVAQMSETEADILVKKVTNKTIGKVGDQKETGGGDIPSPVANRGSLVAGAKHVTGYA